MAAASSRARVSSNRPNRSLAAGVPPSAGYLADLVTKLTTNRPQMILRNAYNDPKAAEWLSRKVGAPVVTLPFSVGGTPEAKDLFGLFDDTVQRLLAARK